MDLNAYCIVDGTLMERLVNRQWAAAILHKDYAMIRYHIESFMCQLLWLVVDEGATSALLFPSPTLWTSRPTDGAVILGLPVGSDAFDRTIMEARQAKINCVLQGFRAWETPLPPPICTVSASFLFE